MADVKELRSEHEYFTQERGTAAREWQKIANFLMPWASNITTKTGEGGKKTKHLYDTTGIDALDKLVSLIVGTATSSTVRWFTGTHDDEEVKADFEFLQWSETVSQRMFDAINRSNYKTEAPMAIRDDVAFGTGNMHVEEVDLEYSKTHGFRGLFFQTVPVGTYTIQEDAFGYVNWTVRDLKLPGREILRRFPKHNIGSESLKQMTDAPHRRYPVGHAIYPEGKNWNSLYYLDIRRNEPEELAEKRYFEFPNLIPRWDKVAGEQWGFGRGHLVLPEVSTLNRARQLKLRQWALSVHPPLLALADGIVGKPRIVPGAINRINVIGALAPFETGNRFDHNAIPENESKLQIRQILFTEQILQFAPNAKTPPSATEVAARLDFLHQLLGASTGRLQDEMMYRLLLRVFHIMDRANAFPPPPAILKQKGGVMSFTFEGPLARAQRGDELRSMGDTIGIVSNLAAVDPAAWDEYDVPMMARDVPRMTGSSRRYMRSPEDKAALQQQRQQAQQAQQQQAAQVQQSEVAKNMGDAQLSTARAGTGTQEPTVS